MTSKKKARKDSPAIERHFGVILEDINSNFNKVLEGNLALEKIFRDSQYRADGDIGSIKLDLRLIKGDTKDLKIRFDRLEDKYDKNFKTIFMYLSRIDDEIQYLKKAFHGNPGLERVECLEQEVAQLKLAVQKYDQNSN